MLERPSRREKKPARAKAANALAAMAELRKTGKRQADTYEVKEEDDVYDMVDEEQYERLVSKRQKEVGSFVVSDGVDGYQDIGEEDWGAAEPSPGHSGDKRDRKEKHKPDGKGTKRKAEDGRKEGKIGRMFAKHKGGTRAATAVRSNPETKEASDALLNDILGDLAPAAAKPPKRQLVSKPPQPNRAGVPPMAKGNPFKKGAATIRVPTSMDAPMDQEMADNWDYQGGAWDDAPPDVEAADLPVTDTGDAQPESGSPKTAEPHGQTPKPQPKALARLQSEALASGGQTPKGPLQQLKQESKTPWRTPQPIAPLPETPATAVAASGWQALCSEAEEADDSAEAKEEEKVWVDDGTLPLGEGGVLPFYFMDAHEEPGAPDTVYLFGKVPKNGTFLSCCALLKGCQRTLFFVPKEGEIADGDGTLSRLEEEAAADPTKRVALLQQVHALAANVKAEVRAVLSRAGVSKFVIKPVRRDYAFELASIPRRQQWVLKVKYPASGPQLPLGLTGERFAAVLGASQSTLEAVLLKRRIMGPSWLSLSKPTRIAAETQVSWCRLEVELGDLKCVMTKLEQPDPPPLTVAAISLKTVVNPNTNVNEIVAASVVHLAAARVDRSMGQAEWNSAAMLRHFSVLRKLEGRPYPPGFEEMARAANESAIGRRNGGCCVSLQGSERALLAFLLAKLQELDADVYAGHNISGFDLDVLLHRLQHHKAPHWSRIGRLKRSTFPSLKGGGSVFGGGASPGLLAALAGRLVCDTYLSARELVKEVDYTLKTLARSLLQQERTDLSDVPGKFENAGKLMTLLRHAESDAWLALGLSFHLNVLPLSRTLAEISGSLWSRALQGQRAQRIEMLLLHEFHRRKFLLPDKMRAAERERLAKAAAGGSGEADGEANAPEKGKGPQYAGGLVLEPKKGLYDRYVLLLDFNSLYPSIIQEYNICFTTVDATAGGSRAALPGPSSDLAPLPKVIQGLVQRRRAVKDAAKRERNATKRAQLDIRQQALKLTANSMYGCLGFAHSRFYARPLAELITGRGREILQSTVDLVQGSVGLEVIYGDTDSIMIASGSVDMEEVMATGQKVKREVNKRYKLLEIEIDAVFKCMLLLKKKKYAAIKLEPGPDGSMQEVVEQKGLDIVRRDWCPLSKDVGNFALQQILSGRAREEVVEAVHAKLREVREKLDQGLVPLNKFVITKQLTKRPQDYPDARTQPHVQVALRRTAEHKRDGIAQGETVPYIICVERNEEGQVVTDASKSLAERAYHPEEVNATPRLAVDNEYYLANQVHPVVSRLCAPIEGTDAARLADCLGLDPSRFRGGSGGGDEDIREDALLASAASLDDDALYKDCAPLKLCREVGETWEFQGVQPAVQGTIAPESLLVSPHSVATGTPLSEVALQNQLRLRMRDEATRYYDGWVRSDDELNPTLTRNICLRSQPGAKPGTLPPDSNSSGIMRQVYTHADVYRQLTHFRRLLGAGQAQLPAAIAAPLNAAAATVASLLDRAAYRWVDLSRLCGLSF